MGDSCGRCGCGSGVVVVVVVVAVGVVVVYSGRHLQPCSHSRPGEAFLPSHAWPAGPGGPTSEAPPRECLWI